MSRGSPNGEAAKAGRKAAALAAAEEVFAVPEEPDLVYLSDALPGFTRLRRGSGFSYRDAEGKTITDEWELARIKRLAIPPAWTQVWISPLAQGHLQATGRDTKGRKQYLYHPRYRQVREANKFGRLLSFGEALPTIRHQANEDLARKDLSKERVLGAVVLLLDRTLIRVGNEEYARTNGAYGLTTLRDEHAEVSSTKLRFVFRAKGGKEHSVGLYHRRLARIVRRCQELPGEELFQFVDEQGIPRPLSSEDVNAYLRELTGEEFTAKDFRTWGGTVITAEELAALGPFESKTEGERKVLQAVDKAAAHLNNTRAVARRSYVHPEVIASYLEGQLLEVWPRLLTSAGKRAGVRPEEGALLELLRLREGKKKTKAAAVANGAGPNGNPGARGRSEPDLFLIE